MFRSDPRAFVDGAPSGGGGAGAQSCAAERLVVVGASGSEGLHALCAFVGALPEDLPAAVLLVMHRPIGAVSFLRQILSRHGRVPVRIAAAGEVLRPGVCYIGPTDEHLTVGARGVVELRPDHRYRNRTVDLLFVGAAESGAARVIGVVLAGSLDDGARGLLAIQRAGGVTMVQRRTVPFPGMPEAALRAIGHADAVGTPAELARATAKALARLPVMDDDGLAAS